VQETVAAIILGPGRWDGWYAMWARQYAQWAPGNLGQLTWPFRCLMDRDDLTGRLGEIGCPALIVHGSQDADHLIIPPPSSAADTTHLVTGCRTCGGRMEIGPEPDSTPATGLN
jgi:pimeloyl-ACP methyl ester carboxylesterase